MRLLFICTHNSARSQMAEAFVNELSREWKAESAGTEATSVNPYVIRVMEELGISMEGHRSKSIEEFRGEEFDLVVTVCDHAKEVCPFFPGKKYMHRSFPYPSQAKGSEEEVLDEFRRVRDMIREWVEIEFVN